MSDKPITSFQLPEGKQLDVHLVRLSDGRVVARTADELARAQPPATPINTSGSQR